MSVFESSPVFHRDSNIIFKSSHRLSKQFDDAYKNFCNRFPQTGNLDKVRFTQEELDAYLENCKRIIRQFIESHNCAWMFQKHNLELGDYEELTKVVLREIFSS